MFLNSHSPSYFCCFMLYLTKALRKRRIWGFKEKVYANSTSNNFRCNIPEIMNGEDICMAFAVNGFC